MLLIKKIYDSPVGVLLAQCLTPGFGPGTVRTVRDNLIDKSAFSSYHPENRSKERV